MRTKERFLCQWALCTPLDTVRAKGRFLCQWALRVPLDTVRAKGRCMCQWALRVSKGTSLLNGVALVGDRLGKDFVCNLLA